MKALKLPNVYTSLLQQLLIFSCAMLIAQSSYGTPCVDLLSELEVGSTKHLKELAAFAYELDVNRSVGITRKWLQYKNGENLSPKVVDLGETFMSEIDPILSAIVTEWSPLPAEPTKYEHAVLLLRKGDTVLFDGIGYRLGEFLGAGNATHIFRLSDHSGAVIRLPFLTNKIGIGKDLMLTEGRDRMDLLISFSRATANALSKSKHAVPLIKADPMYRFLIVGEVHGSINGFSLLEKAYAPQELIRFGSMDKSHFEGNTGMSGSENSMIQELLKVMEDDGQTRKVNDRTYVNVARARQYVWDEVVKSWFLVDGG